MDLAIFLAVLMALPSYVGAVRGAPADWQRYSVLTPAGRERPDPELVRGLERLVYATHVVKQGEYNMWALAKAYGTTMTSMQGTNANELILVSPGQQLTVHNRKGVLYRVRKDGETLDEVLRKYRKDPSGLAALKKKVVEQNNLPGIALLEPYELQPGDVLLLPEFQMEFDTYRFPFAGAGWHRVSSGFGNRRHPILKYRKMHAGVDLPKPYGTPVYAARSGRVIKAGWYEGYGNLVEVRHADGASTRYGHLSKVSVEEGQWVTRGKTLLGKVGSSGLSTGPHLHFEVRDRNGRALNPKAKIGRK